MKYILIIILSLSVINFAQNQISYFENEINIERFKDHLEILASDLFEGRGTGTKGGELAANYIAKQFQKIGLTPIGENNTFFQQVPLHGSSIMNNPNLKLYVNNDTISLNFKEDYLLENTGEQTIIPYPVDVTFAGYGIIAPEFDYNDYLERDVSGKIVVIIDGEPYSDDPEYFSGFEPTMYSNINLKNKFAISRGAAGTIIISAFDGGTKSWLKTVSNYSFENINLLYSPSINFSTILNKTAFKNSFNLKPNFSVKNLEQYFSNNEIKLKFEGDFYDREFKSPNVIGMLNSDKNNSDEYIIVSAHYDHLGIGPEIQNDKIYNGLLDNAMGVSALIEIARTLKKYESILNKSIIFLAVTAEEHGLMGSIYYTDNPIVPLYKTIANINIDGVAYIDDFNSIIGVGAELSDLGEILKDTSKKLNLNVTKIPEEFYSHESFNRSDQIAFAKVGIPSILTLDGIDYKSISRKDALEKIFDYNTNIYHTPFDDLSIEINYNAVKKHTEFLADFIYEISNFSNEIKWKRYTPYNSIRLQTKAEKK